MTRRRELHWGLVCRPSVERAGHVMAELIAYLDEAKLDYTLESTFAESLGRAGVPLDEMDADIFVTVGGDGTILRTLHVTEKPIYAINSGAIGFLTEVEPKFAVSGLKRILDGDYFVEERGRLRVSINGERLPDAANEVTVQSAKIAKMIKFELYVGNEFADTIRGDGVVIATTTGSTGYAMSLGGPIVHPAMDGTIIVPIAPFRMANRPLIVPADKNVKVRVVRRASDFQSKDVKVVVDGQHGFGMPLGAEVEAVKSERVSRFVRFGGGFFERVRNKLMR